MYVKTPSGRNVKGQVVVEVFRGAYRIRLPRQVCGGKQKWLSTGLRESPENLVKAQAIALRIQSDIEHPDNLFDPTLEKYKPKAVVVQMPTKVTAPTIQELWNAYVEYKSRAWKATTIKYMTIDLGRHLMACPVTDHLDALGIRAYLLDRTTEDVTKRLMINLSAVCKWAIKHGKINKNPFNGMAEELPDFNWEVNTKPNALTQAEKEAVLSAFWNHNGNNNGKVITGYGYSHYAPFVEFLFLTGCRPSEAVGLRWGDINSDCSQVSFNGAIVQIMGKLQRTKGSKNNRSRKLNCSTRLTELLTSIKPSNCSPETLVFPSPKGKTIRYDDFSRRAWNKVVNPLINRETTPYSCRDTFITEQIAKGVPTAVVAKWVDNSVAMIEKHYLDSAGLEHLRPL